jgi:predicted peptidase
MKRYDFPKNKSNLLGHIVYTPNRCKEGLPLIVMLHGAGERGNGSDELGKVNAHGIGKYCDNGTMNLDAIVLCPQCPEGNVGNKLTTELKSLIDEIAA